MLYKNKNVLYKNNDLLSLSRNTTIQKKSAQSPVNVISNSLSLKRILIIYYSVNNRKYIDTSAAYSLGLTSLEKVMLDGNDSLIEVSDRQIDNLKNRNLEIRYEQIIDEKRIPVRESIQVFSDDINRYITLGAAYALGLITDQNYYNMTNELYPISENLLVFLNNKYDVQYINLDEYHSYKSK